MTRAPDVICICATGDGDGRGGRPSRWPALLAAAALVVLAAAQISVTVPLLWPLGATAASACLGVWGLRWRLRCRRAQASQSAAQYPARGARAAGPVASTGVGSGPGLRIGDAERDRTLEALREHMAAGRLTVEEFEERCASTLAARTLADLAGTVRDLPELGWSR